MKAPRLTCLLLLYFAVLTQSQSDLRVRWNSTTISRYPDIPDPRVLIYHDEINIRTGGEDVPDGDGVLTCRHSGNPGNVEWLQPGRRPPVESSNNGDFRIITQIAMFGATRFQLARVVQTPATAGNEGLWSCNGGGLPRRFVSLYRRGNGVISDVAVSLQSSSFHSNTFTLTADTTGGPPTIFSWRRINKIALENNTFYSISDPVGDPNGSPDDRENCLYRSTLQVTGVLPGVYEYQVSNRATSGDVTGSFTTEGEAPSNLQVAQVGAYMVEVSWIPPQGSPPAQGYQVVDSENNINIRVAPDRNSLMIDMLPPGFYSFRVISHSQHFPGREAGPETIAVRDAFAPVIALSQLTATSVNVSWTQPMFSLSALRYTVTIRRPISCSSISNLTEPRIQDTNDTNELFQGLEEYISYIAEVTVHFQSCFTVSQVTSSVNFTTPGIAPSEVPSNLSAFTATSTAIGVTWDAIDCMSENGPNFRYEVEFWQFDEENSRIMTVTDKLFTVMEKLQPSTNYIIRVRGVNDIGRGSYTDPIVIQTNNNSDTTVTVSISVVATFILTIILYSALLLIGCYIALAHGSKTSKRITDDTGGMTMKENPAASNKIIDDTGDLSMMENAAYGPVTFSQQPQDYRFTQPDVNSECAYAIVK